MKVTITCDKAGVAYVEKCCAYFKEHGIECRVALPEDGSAFWFDYVDGAEKVAKEVAMAQSDFGVLICGTGIGISLAANKVKGVRAAVCSEPYSAKLTRMHNDANIIAFGARVVGEAMAEMIVYEFLNAKYEGGRHQRRVDMIGDIENR